jgi:hypothetical protein
VTAPTPGFIRDAQRRAARAARVGAPNPADLRAKRLRREGWSERSIEDYEKAGGSPAALLYGLIGIEGGVSTPGGQGTLYAARSSGCQVLLTRQKATGVYGDGKRFRPLVEFEPEEIEPYRKES